ncbi:MAG6410 family transglutaminase-related lipoprotein [Mycoplasma capricolum]|uniref:MAG6410 family transglutaminase-related lipoprotein n=1 Tax=Mycoplasma capricolum TaxID=2095 RepID=UPI003DA39982
MKSKSQKRLLFITLIGSITTIGSTVVSCSNSLSKHNNSQSFKNIPTISNSLNKINNQNINNNSNQISHTNSNSYKNKTTNTNNQNINISNSSIFVNNQTNTLNNRDFTNFYPNKDFEEFIPKTLTEEQIKQIILNNSLSLNHFSHPKFKINSSFVFLEGKDKKAQLKLIDLETNKEIKENVRWYQRTKYPDDVLKPGQTNESSQLELKDDGTIISKNHTNGNAQVSQIWAEYKGYLYSTFVEVLSENNAKSVDEENQARQEAKKIIKENNWQNFPVLEQITKAYEWVTTNIKYDWNLENLFSNQSAYSGLVLKNTVCTGYAKAFKMIMDELNIPSRIITGTARFGNLTGRGSRHAWNMVEIDGKWYHVDPTSDRVEKGQKQEYRFFLLHDDDYDDNTLFFRNDKEKLGSRFRNLKIDKFVETKEDVLALIDKEFQKNKKLTSLEVNVNPKNFKEVNKAFEERNIKLKEGQSFKDFGRVGWANYKKIVYYFDTNNTKEIKEVDVELSKHNESSESMGEYAIKIKSKTNINENLPDLQPKNFVIKNAFVNKVKKVDDGYVLILDHFNNFGDVEIKIESITRQGFNFQLTNNTFEFNVKQHDKLSAILQTTSDHGVILTNVNAGMEYRSNYDQWKDITSDNFKIDDIKPGSFSIRWKNTNNKFSSKIQTFEIIKPSIISNEIKVYSDMITGVNNMMEYRLKEDQNWIPIKANKLVKLKKGIYQIRIKPNKTSLPSEIQEVNVINDMN